VRRALVPTGILEQEFLVIVLGIVPGPCRLYCVDNFLVFGSEMLPLHLLRHTTGNSLLLWCMEENGGAILGAAIRALGIEGGWVMRAIEILDEFIIGDLAWIKLDPECLGMIGVSGADLMIGRVCDIGISASVSNGCFEDAFIILDGPVL